MTAEQEILVPPAGRPDPPPYEDGWLLDGRRAPYLSYVVAAPSVNWSDELEALHEEASRTHFIDRWTRREIVSQLGPLVPSAQILDVGCSTGYLLEDLRLRFPEATLFGVDMVGAGLAKAHQAVPSARLLQADACALPFASGTIDAVASANLLEHVPDDVAALKEVSRILRPGGRAAFVVPAGPNVYDYYDRFLGHERRYARGELAAKCRAAGLVVLEDDYIGSLLYPSFWLIKQRNRARYGQLEGPALEARVAADIARTHDSRVGELLWRAEDVLRQTGVKLPFGIRSVVATRKVG